jgi:ubiquinone/menaquinone biosynthesis C-methylase UbiE
MGIEIDLMSKYPRAKRDLSSRKAMKTQEHKDIARQFGKDFFDGDRNYGYGGYSYLPHYWKETVKEFVRYYNLNKDSKILDVGCGKGFMLYDFLMEVPGIKVEGIDISSYAIENGKPEVKNFLKVANATELPYADHSFDLVVSITTVHNLNRIDCAKSLKEIMRVTKKDAFITVDAYRDDEEKERMDAWNLTALTYMHTEEWKEFFKENHYTGDYFWFLP